MTDTPNYMELAAKIVSAYVSNNSLPAADLPALIGGIHLALVRVSSGVPIVVAPEPPTPAVSPKKSITNDFLICLEDSARFNLGPGKTVILSM
jgi:predicted transcriptional regulator